MNEKNDNDTNYQELKGEVGHKKVRELLDGLHIAMMTTIAQDGTISSRPMAVQNVPFTGTLWFLTRSTSDKIREIKQNQKTTLAFAEPKDSKFISMKRQATVSRDRSKIKELWNPLYP